MNYTSFIHTVWDHYDTHGRDMPWRINTHRSSRTVTPYHILVSELMLQQTQVSRVIPKYKTFISYFPTFKSLTKANIKDVLTYWKGLGYNRRAINLKHTAEIITKQHNGTLPRTQTMLITLPGIGPYTSSAVLAFAFNIPSVFIETNIRTVFTYHFFSNRKNVDDKELLPIIKKTLDQKHPRKWYYALMDYGAYLKQNGVKINNKNKQYIKQTPFKGSNREARSKILTYIMEHGPTNISTVAKATGYHIEVIEKNLKSMKKEGFLHRQGNIYEIY